MPSMVHSLAHIQELVVLDRSECQTAEAEVPGLLDTVCINQTGIRHVIASSSSVNCDAKPCDSLCQILAQHLIGSPSMALALRAVQICALWMWTYIHSSRRSLERRLEVRIDGRGEPRPEPQSPSASHG